MKSWKWPMRLCVGLAAGIAIAWVDNFAFEGEVSPIVIVVMLLAATATIAAVWGRHGWATARRCVVVRTARSSHQTRSWAAGHLAPEHVHLHPDVGGVHVRGGSAWNRGWHADSPRGRQNLDPVGPGGDRARTQVRESRSHGFSRTLFSFLSTTCPSANPGTVIYVC